MSAAPWESLAGLRGTADRCTCSDAQLANVGCDCDAGQNLPVRCQGAHCEAFLRTNEEIVDGFCQPCAAQIEREKMEVRNAEDDYQREGNI